MALDTEAPGHVGDAPDAHVLGEARGGDVERALDGLAHGDRSVELVVVILGRPEPAGRLDLERRIVQEVGERDLRSPVHRLEGGDVDEGLEGAARLASRLGAAIELRDRVAATPDQGDDLPRLRAQCDEAALEAPCRVLAHELGVGLLEPAQTVLQRLRR